MHITISEIMRCGVREVRDLPFFQSIAFIKAYGQIHKGTTEDEQVIDADDPANQDEIDKLLNR
jgi:hypothetical protein